MPAKDPHAVALGRKGGKARTPAKTRASRQSVRKATAAALEARACYGVVGGTIYRYHSPSARAAAGAEPILARDPRVSQAQRRGDVQEG